MISKPIKETIISYCHSKLQIDVSTIGAIVPMVVILPDKARPNLSVRLIQFDVFDTNLKHRAVIRSSHLKRMSS